MKSTSKSSLSRSQIRLIELMQEINFGRIKVLPIRDGEPVLDPLPRLIRDLKLGAENGPRSELGHDDFLLKEEVVELFAQFQSLGNATITSLEVKRGLPFRIHWEVVAA